MKIAVVTSGRYCDNYGGGQVYVRQVVQGLRDAGVDVSVFSIIFVKHATQINDVLLDGINIREICLDSKHIPPGCNSELNELIITKTIEALRCLKPDVVHANGWKATFALACREVGIPCVITAHHGGIVCPSGSLLNADNQICHLPVGRHCVACCQAQLTFGKQLGAALNLFPHSLQDYISLKLSRLPTVPYLTWSLTAPVRVEQKYRTIEAICNSRARIIAPSVAIQSAVVRNGIPGERTVVVPHGTTISHRLQAKVSTERKAVRLVYSGRICYVKGLHVLLEALKNVPGNWELHMLGTAHTKWEKRYLMNLVKIVKEIPDCECVIEQTQDHKQIKPRKVYFHGHLHGDKYNSVFSWCDLFVLPSICLEVFGLVVLEAFANGLPAIVTDSGGPSEIVRHGIDGVVVPPNSSEALAREITQFVADPSRIKEFSSRIREVKSISEYTQDLLKVYKSVKERETCET